MYEQWEIYNSFRCDKFINLQYLKETKCVSNFLMFCFSLRWNKVTLPIIVIIPDAEREEARFKKVRIQLLVKLTPLIGLSRAGTL